MWRALGGWRIRLGLEDDFCFSVFWDQHYTEARRCKLTSIAHGCGAGGCLSAEVWRGLENPTINSTRDIPFTQTTHFVLLIPLCQCKAFVLSSFRDVDSSFRCSAHGR